VVLGISIDSQLEARSLYEEGWRVGVLKQVVGGEDKDENRLWCATFIPSLSDQPT
jgi:hypothetical protein